MRYHNSSFQLCLVNILTSVILLSFKWICLAKAQLRMYQTIWLLNACTQVVYWCWRKKKSHNKGNWYHHKSYNGAEEGHWPLLNPQDYHRIFCFSTYSHLPHPILLKLLTLSLLPHSRNLISPFTWLRKQKSLDNSLNFQPPNLQTHLYLHSPCPPFFMSHWNRYPLTCALETLFH